MVLDNKNAEWQELLKLASAIEQFMPSVATGGELIQTVHDPLFREHLCDMTECAMKCAFIPTLQNELRLFGARSARSRLRTWSWSVRGLGGV
jgi:hypothetical protein